MKFISCASYYGSGSSAITDLISEYNNVFSFTDEEFRFLHDPDGISDLEYNLVENFNRHNSGWALKKYKRLVDFYSGNFFNKRYEKFFHGKWKTISYNYIQALTDFKYHGWWQYDLLSKGKWFYFKKRFPNKFLHETIWRNKPERTLNLMKNEITYCSHPSSQKFIDCTKKYIEDLFSSVNQDKEYFMVDQIVPSTNIKRYNKYFNDIRVFIVDRDPRDVYILEKYFWQDGIIPTDPVLFCKWFKYTRDTRKQELIENKNVKYIQFEDLVYKYDYTVKNIEKWLNFKSYNHEQKKKHFNPEKSKNNTRTWLKFADEQKNIGYIEEQLKSYLYDYKNL